MLIKFALLTVTAFGLGLIVPLPQTLIGKEFSEQAVVAPAPDPTFKVESAIVDGVEVVRYTDASETPASTVSNSDTATIRNKKADMADLQNAHVI